MTVKIKSISGNKGFFQEEDEILSIDDIEICDQLDILFLSAEEGAARFTVRRKSGRIVSRRIRFSTLERAMPVFEEMEFKNCRSRCVFCFVDQMPPKMRKSLYLKDDDYRLSFLFGNYVTMNDITDSELDRIIKYNLSPLYVSIHATGKKIRKTVFGRPMKRDILADLRYLAENDITYHAQIVLVNNLNTGKVLDRTVREIMALRPACRSLAIVPVGLTKHRRGLNKLRGFTRMEARNIVDWAEETRNKYSTSRLPDPFLFLSDEFYLLAGKALPPGKDYGDYEQLSNGIGMCRNFIDETIRDVAELTSAGRKRFEMTVVTGRLGSIFLKKYIVPILNREMPDADVEIVTASNLTFGKKVTVSGLLAGKDIIEALDAGKQRGCVVLPPNCVNHDGVFLDNITPGEIENITGRKIIIPERSFLEESVIIQCNRRNGR
ncbi:MAG: DUF512 domain-containing protein [Candidatus Krumholzibacteria bacterium]|nr:DUF512 domain-containing protein [Candidatus Krumholzibacteria bacterium]